MNKNPQKKKKTRTQTNAKLRKTLILKKRQTNLIENRFSPYPTDFPGSEDDGKPCEKRRRRVRR